MRLARDLRGTGINSHPARRHPPALGVPRHPMPEPESEPRPPPRRPPYLQSGRPARRRPRLQPGRHTSPHGRPSTRQRPGPGRPAPGAAGTPALVSPQPGEPLEGIAATAATRQIIDLAADRGLQPRPDPAGASDGQITIILGTPGHDGITGEVSISLQTGRILSATLTPAGGQPRRYTGITDFRAALTPAAAPEAPDGPAAQPAEPEQGLFPAGTGTDTSRSPASPDRPQTATQHREELHAAVDFLAALPGYAPTTDGPGLTEADTCLGLFLADLPAGQWTEEMSIAAWAMLGRYTAQLGEAGINYDNLPRPPGAEHMNGAQLTTAHEAAERQMTDIWPRMLRDRLGPRFVRCDAHGAAVMLGYDLLQDRDIRLDAEQIPGSHGYALAARASIYPFTSLADVIALADQHGIPVTQDVRALTTGAARPARQAITAAVPAPALSRQAGPDGAADQPLTSPDQQQPRPQQITGSDLAIALRRMAPRLFAAMIENGREPTRYQCDGCRGDGEPDPGASELLEFDRAGLRIRIGAPGGVRDGTLTWAQIRRWIQPGLTPARQQLLAAAARAHLQYIFLAHGYAVPGTPDCEALRQASRELDGILRRVIDAVTSTALSRRGDGPLPHRTAGPAAQPGDADNTLPLPGPGDHADADTADLARVAEFASVLPDRPPHRTKPVSQVEPGDILRRAGQVPTLLVVTSRMRAGAVTEISGTTGDPDGQAATWRISHDPVPDPQVEVISPDGPLTGPIPAPAPAAAPGSAAVLPPPRPTLALPPPGRSARQDLYDRLIYASRLAGIGPAREHGALAVHEPAGPLASPRLGASTQAGAAEPGPLTVPAPSPVGQAGAVVITTLPERGRVALPGGAGSPGTRQQASPPADPARTAITPLAAAAAAGGLQRPHRLVYPDGTELACRPGGQFGSAWTGIAAGIAADPGNSTGWLQAVLRGDGRVELIHPAVLAPARINPYALIRYRDQQRFSLFDPAEADGRDSAPLPATLVDVGDLIRAETAPGSGQVDIREVTGVRTAGIEVHITTTGPGSGTRTRPPYQTRDRIEVMIPAWHPAEAGPYADRLFAPRPRQVQTDPAADLISALENRVAALEREVAGLRASGTARPDDGPTGPGAAEGSAPGPSAGQRGWAEAAASAGQVRQALAVAAGAVPGLRQDRLWTQVRGLADSAHSLARDASAGRLRFADPARALRSWRRMWARVCELTCDLAARVMTDWLRGPAGHREGSRAWQALRAVHHAAAEGAAHAHGWLPRYVQLPIGSYEPPGGRRVTAAPARAKADASAHLHDLGAGPLGQLDYPGPLADLTARHPPGRHARPRAARAAAARAAQPGGHQARCP